jgi:hypothetical protein
MVYNSTGGVIPDMPVMETRKKPWSGWSYDPWSFQFLPKTGGADGATPPSFLLLDKEQVASLKFLKRLTNNLFFCMIL